MVRVPANLPPKVMDELQTLHGRVKPFGSAALMWDRVFTTQERRRLGGDLNRSFVELHTVGMWRKVRGGSDARALIDIAHAIGLLNQSDHAYLLRKIGEKPLSRREPSLKPVWDKINGELRLDGKVIRSIRLLRSQSNIQKILDAFKRARWTRQIDNTLSLDQEQLHQALRSLNSSMKLIRFHSSSGGRFISWAFV